MFNLRILRGQLKTTYPRGQGAVINELVLHDRLLLGLGTQVIGTTDGEHLHRRNMPGRIFAALTHDGALYVAGANGLMAVSTDRGESWETLPAAPKDRYLMALTRTSRGEWWLGGMSGVWKAPAPRGPWTQVVDSARPRTGKTLFFFEHADQLFICGADTRRTSADGLHAVPGIDASALITRITRSPRGTLIAIGDAGVLLRSDNGGQSFAPVTAGTQADLEDCAWVGDTLVVVGARGTLLTSSDDGQTFSSRTLETSNTFRSIVSWSTGALVGGEEDLLIRLEGENDSFWAGATDELAPRAPEVDPSFIPTPQLADREAKWQALHHTAVEFERALVGNRAAPVDENPELARAVDDADDPTAALRVYADWLEAKGDERARLAMLQHSLAEGRGNVTQREVDELAAKFLPAELLREVSERFWEATWQSGFLKSLRVFHPYLEGESLDLSAVILAVLNHPSARFLREFTVGVALDPSQGDQNEYGGVAEAIGARLRPSLRKLFLGDFHSEETELNWTHSGNLSPLWGALPRLRHVVLRAGGMNFGTAVAPNLESFAVVTGGLSAEAARQVASAKLPALKHLSLQVGPEGTAGLADLQPILEATDLPRLVSLGLSNLAFMEPLVEALSRSPVLGQVRALDLSMSTLGLDGAKLMLRRRAAFSHLDSLNVNDNYLPAEAEPLLRGLAKQLIFGEQRDDGGDAEQRYASALE